MNNIVTIDFDIIMQPSIESYNVLVDTLYPIDTIIRDYPHMDNAQANLYIYQKLTDMIFKTIKRLESDKIIFIMNHHNVLDCISDYNTLSLVNIDHHHDLGYKDYNYYNNVLDCGNWIKHLYEEGRLDSYLWINNDTTKEYPAAEESGYVTQIIPFFQVAEHLDFFAETADMLIICASFEWVPPQYRNLFFTWKEMCDNFYGKEVCLIDKEQNFTSD